MKIIPHPALLKEREEKIKEAEMQLAQRARDLHILETVIRSQEANRKREILDRNFFYVCIFMSGLLLGFSLPLLFLV